jgi:hypothetical protein
VILANTGVVGAVNRLGPLNRNDGNALLPDDFWSPRAFDNANTQRMTLPNVAFGPMTLSSMVADRDLRTGRLVMRGGGVRPDISSRFRGGASCKQHQNKCVSHMASYEGEAILVQPGGLYKCL